LIGALGVERRVPAVVDVDPDVLNPRSRGRWITCYIELPQGYDPEDIDVCTVTLDGTVPAEEHPTEVGDYDGDGIHDRMVKFSRSEVIRMLPLEERAELRVSGEVAGQTFEGADTIRVLMPKVTYPNGREVLAVGNQCESPPSFALHGCSPNPFTAGTSIRFDVPSSCQVRLAILDVQGRLVRELISEELPARPHTVTWDGTDSSGNKVVPGFYFARLKAGDFIDTARMMLLR
jgi:hypothetical protein